MCWWLKVSVPLVYNLGVRIGDGVLDMFYGVFHCLTDVIAGKSESDR